MCSIAYFDATSEAADRLITEFATVEDHADAARHSRLRRRRQTLTVRSLLRAILAREVSASAASPWRLLRGPQGYPDEAISGTTRRVVSLAHSGTIVACATAPDGMIGVDVERI